MECGLVAVDRHFSSEYFNSKVLPRNTRCLYFILGAGMFASFEERSSSTPFSLVLPSSAEKAHWRTNVKYFFLFLFYQRMNLLLVSGEVWRNLSPLFGKGDSWNVRGRKTIVKCSVRTGKKLFRLNSFGFNSLIVQQNKEELGTNEKY